MGQGAHIAGLKRRKRSSRPVPAGFAGLLLLSVLPACSIEMGPPPASDPPLVQEGQKQPPPPAQPTEPQAWSRDLDFDGGEGRVRRGELAEGLIAAEQTPAYSGERLTFESAGSSSGKPTEAELIRERARKRMEAAQSASPGAAEIAPPEVVAAPVETVTAETLPAPGSGIAEEIDQPSGDQPPVETASGDRAGVSDRTEAQGPQDGAIPRQAASLPDDAALATRPGPADKLKEQPAPAGEAGGPAIESWDPPDGTILVQVSALQERQQVVGEWERLKKGYPGVLGPLRLVVEEARVGDRGVFFRVQAGGFESQEEAEAACVTLTGQGQPCFVLEKAAGG